MELFIKALSASFYALYACALWMELRIAPRDSHRKLRLFICGVLAYGVVTYGFEAAAALT